MSCCPSGAAPHLAADHADEGSTGEHEGVQYYQVGSGPRGLLLLGDVWGWNGGRARAVADNMAKRGLSVWVPKLLEAHLGGTDEDGLPPSFDLASRFAEVREVLVSTWLLDSVPKRAERVVEAMRASGVEKYGILGFCFGAWVGMRLAAVLPSAELVAAASPHPSINLERLVGGDPVAVCSRSSCPWALYPCGDAEAGGDEAGYDKDGDMFRALEQNHAGLCETRRFCDMQHGFVVRGAFKSEGGNEAEPCAVKKAVQECLDDVARFFVKRGLLRE